jgi:hypothetical protein
MTVSSPFSMSIAGPSTPFVASAVTTPPAAEVAFEGVEPFSSFPPPPQPATRTIAANATNLRMGRLCPFRQVCCIGFSA